MSATWPAFPCPSRGLSSGVRGHGTRFAALLASVLLLCCRDAASAVIPETSLGAAARAWLFAHNQGDGHAMVHFTLENRGSAPMDGAQVDSTVYDGVRFAREVGPVEPLKLLESGDSSLSVLLRSKRGDVWKAQFTPARQPSPVRVRVEVSRASEAQDAVR